MRFFLKLAKQFRLDEAGARERNNAEYGCELVGLNIHIPWSAWDGYPDGSGFETGTDFQYLRRLLARPIPTVTAAQRGAVWGRCSRRRTAVVARALRRWFPHQARRPHV